MKKLLYSYIAMVIVISIFSGCQSTVLNITVAESGKTDSSKNATDN